MHALTRILLVLHVIGLAMGFANTLAGLVRAGPIRRTAPQAVLFAVLALDQDRAGFHHYRAGRRRASLPLPSRPTCNPGVP